MRLGFIHVPKTGGVNFSPQGALYDLICSKHELINFGHRKIDHDVFDRSDFVFAVKRNPWDRLVSIYFYQIQGGRPKYRGGEKVGWHPHELAEEARYKFLRDYSFEEFVFNLKNEEFKNRIIHIVSQTDCICMNGEIAVNRLISFEKYAEDTHSFLREMEILGPDEKVDIPVLNSTNHRPYKEYYTSQKLIDMVGEIYKNDVEMLGYSFDGEENQND